MNKTEIYDALCKALTDYENDETSAIDFYGEIVEITNQLAEEIN